MVSLIIISTLYRLAAQAQAGTTGVFTDVRVMGPFGQLSLLLKDYDHVCVIAGGIGITPMLPILQVSDTSQ